MTWGVQGFWDAKETIHCGEMIGVVKQDESGIPVTEPIRKAGVSEQMFLPLECVVCRLAQPQEENTPLKRLVAELKLDMTMLQDVQ